MRLCGLMTAAVLIALACPSHASWEAISQVAQPLFVRGGESGVWIATVPYVGHALQSYDQPAVVLLTSAPNLVSCDGRTENRNFAALAGIHFTIERRRTGYVLLETVLQGDTLRVTVETEHPSSWTYNEPLEDVFAASLWCGLLNARQAWPQVQFVDYRIAGNAAQQYVNYQGVYSLADISPTGSCVKWNRGMTASLTGRCSRRRRMGVRRRFEPRCLRRRG